MANRVGKLLEAYFNSSLKEYSELVSDISGSGGLTPEEVAYLMSSDVLDIDAWAIVRHAGVRSRAASLGRE